MDDVKNQFKGLMKKFTSSSPKFKGEGHRLGSGPESSQRPAQTQGYQQRQQHADVRKLQQERWERERSALTTRQDRSHISTASSETESQPSNLPDISSGIAVAPADSNSSKRPNGSSDDDIEDDLCCVLNAQSTQNSNGFQEPFDMLQPKTLDQADMDSVNSSQCEYVRSHLDDGRISSSAESMGAAAYKPDANCAQNESSPVFDPFSSHIGSLSSSANMDGLQMYQCPVCGNWWKSEAEINAHIDECLIQSTCTPLDNIVQNDTELHDDNIKVSLGTFLSAGPSHETKDVLLRILRNIVNNPDLEKFRKIRLSNPKIHDTLGMAIGGIQLLEAVGFIMKAAEEEEVWAVMNHPSSSQINSIQGAITALEKSVSVSSKTESSSEGKASVQEKVDRQMRVFYAAPEDLAAKIELPDSFYQLSISELRQEAAARKKNLEDSELLVSRVSRDRMAAANKRKYKAAIIRIQFFDGVVLQGTFLPWELTTAIYEFVSHSLRDPGVQFILVSPGSTRKVIPAFAKGQAKVPTLEEANLVPASLIKFQCVEPDSSPFTGLHPDILVALEPLSSTALPC